MSVTIGSDVAPPVAIAEHDPAPFTVHSIFQLSLASGAATAPLLAAPAAGSAWEIAMLACFTTAAPTAASTCGIQGATSGFRYLTRLTAVGADPQLWIPCRIFVTEALNGLSQASGVQLNYVCMARQITRGTF